MENQGPPTPHPGSAATIDRKIERLLNVNSSSSQYIHDIECFFEFCGKLLARENETKHSSKHLDYAKSLLVAQIEKTSARREDTIRGLAAAEDTMKSLEALRLGAAGNFCAKKLKRELGDAKYNYLANEWLLAEITNQRASAGNNMQLWLRKKEKATIKIEELGYSNHELGTLVMAMVNGQVYDECSSKDLFTMERKNRKMVIRWQLMGHKARGGYSVKILENLSTGKSFWVVFAADRDSLNTPTLSLISYNFIFSMYWRGKFTALMDELSGSALYSKNSEK